MTRFYQIVAMGIVVAGLIASGERSTLVTQRQPSLEASQPRHANAQHPVVKLCPVGGERYPEEARDCPIHHVQLTELMLVRLRLEERSSRD